MILDAFSKLPLLGILRGISKEEVEPILETSQQAGLGAIEITMNTPGADGLIRKAVSSSCGKIAVGAGTVLNMEEVKRAVGQGASFIVSPVFISLISEYCNKNNIPFFPGALTPQEVFNAWEGGATMVKVFPSSSFGPAYFKALKGPLNKVKLMAVGGVNLDNIDEYFSCGASAVAFGASVFKAEWLKDKNYKAIQQLISRFVEKILAINLQKNTTDR